MNTVRYLLSGASSGLGQALARTLAANPAAEIIGLVSGRRMPELRHARIRYIEQDLTKPLGPQAADAMRTADRIVHLAWSRSGTRPENAAANSAMLETLLCSPDAAQRLVFVSSVAASPRSPSGYGRTKFAAQSRVLAAGGTVVVIGLMVGEPAETGFKTLLDLLRRLPFAPRLLPNAPKVYPVLQADAVAVLAAVTTGHLPPAAYRAFLADGIAINDFIDWILQRERLDKLRLPLPLPLVTLATRTVAILGLTSLAEKLGTFFFKDEHALRTLQDPPAAALHATQAAFSHADRASESR